MTSYCTGSLQSRKGQWEGSLEVLRKLVQKAPRWHVWGNRLFRVLVAANRNAWSPTMVRCMRWISDDTADCRQWWPSEVQVELISDVGFCKSVQTFVSMASLKSMHCGLSASGVDVAVGWHVCISETSRSAERWYSLLHKAGRNASHGHVTIIQLWQRQSCYKQLKNRPGPRPADTPEQTKDSKTGRDCFHWGSSWIHQNWRWLVLCNEAMLKKSSACLCRCFSTTIVTKLHSVILVLLSNNDCLL